MKIRHASPGRKCSVVVSLDDHCDAPAIVEFDGRNGDVLAECVAHALASDVAKLDAAADDAPAVADYRLPSGARSKSSAAYLLVDRSDVIRGYAESDGPAVAKRAARLSARIVRNPAVA